MEGPLRYRVRSTDPEIRITRPGGEPVLVEWPELARVELVTVGRAGLPAFFWALRDRDGALRGAFPAGAEGEPGWLSQLGARGHLQEDALEQAGACQEERTLVVWTA